MDRDPNNDNAEDTAEANTAAQAFIERWKPSGGAERANYQSFLIELCDLIGVPHPDPALPEGSQNAYVFEKAIVFDNRDGTHSTKFADLYKRGAFICETKQGVEADDDKALLSGKQKKIAKKRKAGHGKRGSKAYDETMQRAHGQAASYARNLPAEEGRPPFLLVIDVGHRIELYSEFSQTGGAYVPFPDPRSHRLKLADLADAQVRERLRLVWTDPLSLDPARHSAKVTRQIAGKLAALAKSLEGADHSAEDVAQFLMRCLFTMFAEDVGLLPQDGFLDLLRSIEDPEHFAPLAEQLWKTMDTGGFSTQLRKELLRFNGGLFADQKAIPINRDQLDLMIEAAAAKWNDVEPAIFGTLLERALDPVERHKLGAHYTPRAYVERLVVPTVVEPLRAEWDAARAAAVTLATTGDSEGAAEELTKFHDHLCEVRVLDPACGSGNFLYVVLEHLKRLEGEVFAAYDDLCGEGSRQQLLVAGHTVNPEQLLGIEINPRAAAIAELVLWIGYLQWHFRTQGRAEVPIPVLRDLHNIENRDAVLAYDSREPVMDDAGEPVTIWDGRTTKPHPVTGEEVPDDTARVPTYHYANPRKAEWPQADYVVGNPPFIGTRRMRSVLGDGYVDALSKACPEITMLADYVMWWWLRAANVLSEEEIDRGQLRLRQFGFITTNSIRQSFNRKVVAAGLKLGIGNSITWAVPDHPWVDSADGASVRVAMTVVRNGDYSGIVLALDDSHSGEVDSIKIIAHGSLGPDLRASASLQDCNPLEANSKISYWGAKFYGSGFIFDSLEEARALSTSAVDAGLIRQFVSGRDLTGVDRVRYAIDAFGMSSESLQDSYPSVYQHLLDYVKPDRDHNREAFRRNNWWIFGRPQPGMRTAVNGLSRYIATTETAKHRVFQFLPENIFAEGTVSVLAIDDACFLGTLSSHIHVTWAFTAGGRLGVGNDPRYNSTVCLDPFPFPDATESQKARIRELGEQLDAHRKRQQELHERLTMTGMYNVLEKLRSEEALSDNEKTIHEQGLVSVLRDIHDKLDAAVADAYGWPVDLADEEILERLVALNHERAEEEERGIIRWLRPEFQNPDGVTQKGVTLTDDKKKPTKKTKAKVKKQPWPASLSEQAAAVQAALVAIGAPADEKAIAKRFTGRFVGAKKDRIAELLETLESLGQARQLDDGSYVTM